MPTAERNCPRAGCEHTITGQQRHCQQHATEWEQMRGTRKERGYDQAHDDKRAELLPLAYGKRCVLCDKIMTPAQPLDLDHSEPLRHNRRSTGDRIVHASCNRSWRGRETD